MGFNLPLLNRRRRIGGFNPRAILAGSTAIAWFDPSDLPTLFQDAAGTTPVTAPAQPVGLVLDKSQGLVLGPELVTNGDFSNGTTGWTLGGVVISGGVAVATSAVTLLTQTISSLVSGKSYLVSFNYTMSSGTRLRIEGSGILATSLALASSGTVSLYIIANSTNFTIAADGSAFTGTVDNISVRELPGFHATQSTAANRPTYGVVPSRGRVNLLTFTEDLTNAVWTNPVVPVAVTSNTTAAPNGTLTADKLVPPASTNVMVTRQSVGFSTTTYTMSVWAKLADAGVHLELLAASVSGACGAVFNLSTGAVLSFANCTTAVSADDGNGWRRYSVTFSAIAGANPFDIRVTEASTRETAMTGNGSKGIFVWGAQLETGSTASPYQRVVSQFEVTDPAGFPSYPLHYLFFGGNLDPRWLQTATITPNADKVQVFAGVRKLSDAATAILVESSADLNTNAGSFYITQPNNTFGSNAFVSRGSIVPSQGASFAAFAPVTNVLTGLGDISGDLATLRVNGTQAAQSTADQGTGNYLAYPLFIGRRGGTSNAFNGQLYGLIVRFSTANLDAGLVGQTENWMAQKTGAFSVWWGGIWRDEYTWVDNLNWNDGV